MVTVVTAGATVSLLRQLFAFVYFENVRWLSINCDLLTIQRLNVFIRLFKGKGIRNKPRTLVENVTNDGHGKCSRKNRNWQETWRTFSRCHFLKLIKKNFMEQITLERNFNKNALNNYFISIANHLKTFDHSVFCWWFCNKVNVISNSVIFLLFLELFS